MSHFVSLLSKLRKFGPEFSMTGVETKRTLGKGMNSTRGKFGRMVSCSLYIGLYNLSLNGEPNGRGSRVASRLRHALRLGAAKQRVRTARRRQLV
jgi:hypothetical protein